MRTLAMVAALLGIPAAMHTEAAEPMPGPAVVVRFYKTTIPAEDLSAARRRAAGILDGAGIAVSWSGCWSDAGSIAPGCQRPPAVNEMILHIVAATDANAKSHRHSLGFSIIDRGTATGTVATV